MAWTLSAQVSGGIEACASLLLIGSSVLASRIRKTDANNGSRTTSLVVGVVHAIAAITVLSDNTRIVLPMTALVSLPLYTRDYYTFGHLSNSLLGVSIVACSVICMSIAASTQFITPLFFPVIAATMLFSQVLKAFRVSIAMSFMLLCNAALFILFPTLQPSIVVAIIATLNAFCGSVFTLQTALSSDNVDTLKPLSPNIDTGPTVLAIPTEASTLQQSLHDNQQGENSISETYLRTRNSSILQRDKSKILRHRSNSEPNMFAHNSMQNYSGACSESSDESCVDNSEDLRAVIAAAQASLARHENAKRVDEETRTQNLVEGEINSALNTVKMNEETVAKGETTPTKTRGGVMLSVSIE